MEQAVDNMITIKKEIVVEIKITIILNHTQEISHKAMFAPKISTFDNVFQ
jgi:hypothetical protein